MGPCSDGEKECVITAESTGTKSSVRGQSRTQGSARASVDATSTAARTMAEADLSQTLRGRGM